MPNESPTTLNGEPAEALMRLIPADRNHPYHQENHPDHRRAVDEVNARFGERFTPAAPPGAPGTPREGPPSSPSPAAAPELQWAGPHDTLSPDAVTDFAASAVEAGVGGLAQDVLDAIATGSALPDTLPACPISREEGEAALRREWGDAAYERNLTLARWAAQLYGPHVMAKLNAGWGNSPVVAQLLLREGARHMIRSELADPKSPYHAGRPEYVQAMQRMFKLARRRG